MTTEMYLGRIQELIAAYNEKNESGTHGSEEEAIHLLLDARTLVREALGADHSNDDLVQLHVELAVVLSRYFFAKALSEENYTQSLIGPEEFARRWAQEESSALVRIGREATAEWNIAEDSAQFLAEAGLPVEAAPFLAFGQAGRLWEVWDFGQDTDYARELFPQYIQIGTDGSGNAVCIDEEHNGIVVLLDRDFGFQAISFVNSSVQQLAECLLVYRTALDEQRLYGGEGLAGLIGQEFMRIDSRAMGRECFWHREVLLLQAQHGE